MQRDLLFEIGTEEIPAGYIMPALENMKKILCNRLGELELSFGTIRTAATPRRLTIGIENLAARQQDRREEVLGPPKKAGFDTDNKPTKAAEGFAKSRGVGINDIRIAQTDKGEYLMVVVEKKGEETEQLLPEILTNLICDIPFPKSMRWAAGQKSFARPVQWLLALYGETIIPCRINNIESANLTRGHRFMARESFRVENFDTYLEKLRAAQVLADPAERRARVITEIERAAKEAGGRILADEDLIDTVTNLVEIPHAICGSFDPKFLQLPKEVLITSMREHQKYFAIEDKEGRLLPNFIAVNNTITKDTTLAAEGHQRVIRARLEDAFFFFKEDRNRPLADLVENLSGVIFQAGLGTMAEKTERIKTLAAWLAEKCAPDKIDSTRRAAGLAKADLLTGMVNEFPTLQGVMGRAYALLHQENPEVADAIRDHYLPVRAGGPLPEGTIGALVGLADRMDSLAGCFGIGKLPTGTTDPFGLRRLAIALINIIEHHAFTISLADFASQAIDLYGDKLTEERKTTLTNVLEFIKGRYVNDKTGRGVPPEAVEAVTSVSFDDLGDCRRRIESLVEISREPAFNILAGSFKRVRNIIKDNRDTAIDQALLVEAAEKKLHAAFQTTLARCTPLLDTKDYTAAMAVILTMKEPVDRFFDTVMVMAEDKMIQKNRLALLTAIAQLFLRIGDFSKMSSLTR